MRVELELYPFIAESFSIHKELYRLIDKVYKKDELKYKNAIKKYKYTQRFANGSIEHDMYYYKVLGILLENKSYDGNSDFAKLMNKFEDCYKYECMYITSVSILRLTEYCYKLSRKFPYISDDEFSFHIYIVLFLAVNNEVQIDTEDELLLKFIQNSFILLNKPTSHRNVMDKETESIIKNKIREIEKVHPKIFKLPFYHKMARLDSDGHMILEGYSRSDRNNIAYEFIHDLNNISVDKLFEPLNNKEIIDLLFCYYICHQDTFENDSVDTILEWLIPALQVNQSLIAYNKAKKFINNNSNDNLLIENRKLNDKIDELNNKSNTLLHELDSVKKQNELLLKENERFKKELLSFSKEKMEINSLREFMFNQSKEVDENASVTDFEFIASELNKVDCVIIGGHGNWIKGIKKYLNWTFINANSLNFDYKLLNNKIVILNTDYLSHGMYYKVVEHMEIIKDLKFFSGHTNIELSVEKLYKLIN